MNTQIMSAVADGNLLALTPAQRVEYYEAVCASIGVNPLTRPFGYILFEEKKPDGSKEKRLELYARADLTAQLRKVHGVSIMKEEHRVEADGTIYIHTVYLQDGAGRTDIGTGAVALVGYEGKPFSPSMLANSYMRAETKAKRRGTLSLCGLAVLDESELDTIANAHVVTEAVSSAADPDTGEIFAPPQAQTLNPNPPPAEPHWATDKKKLAAFHAKLTEIGVDHDQAHRYLNVNHLTEYQGSGADAIRAIRAAVDAEIRAAQILSSGDEARDDAL